MSQCHDSEARGIEGREIVEVWEILAAGVQDEGGHHQHIVPAQDERHEGTVMCGR